MWRGLSPPSLGKGAGKKMTKTSHFGALVAAVGALVAVGLLGLMLLVVEARPAGAAFPGKNGKIAFVSDRAGGNLDIYTMNSDGTGVKRLTDYSGPDLYPSFSPDGSTIAFTREPPPGVSGGRQELYTINSDGTGGARQLTYPAQLPEFDMQPSFSPSGKIVFTSNRYGAPQNRDIYMIAPPNVGSPVRLTQDPANQQDPAFSPDGTKIAFRNKPAGQPSEIFTMKPDGSGWQRLTNTGTSNTVPDFSPDGRKIAWTSSVDPGSNFEIFTMNSDGTGQTRVTNDPDYDSDAVFSPDGNKIAFARGVPGKSEIYTMNTNGTGLQRLTTNAATDIQPDWQPLP
jgi:Tol biopolymer transport system component